MSAGHHLFWITSRAAGTAALITASVSVAIGILIGSRRSATAPLSELRPVHEALSLATLALIALHGISLLGDHFLHPGLAGIAIPLVGPYRPAWTAIGIVAGYGLAALGLSYYWRDAIGSGTDALQPWFLFLTGAAVLPAAFLVVARTARGLASALDLPRSESPLREVP